jgi:hypothetical protein
VLRRFVNISLSLFKKAKAGVHRSQARQPLLLARSLLTKRRRSAMHASASNMGSSKRSGLSHIGAWPAPGGLAEEVAAAPDAAATGGAPGCGAAGRAASTAEAMLCLLLLLISRSAHTHHSSSRRSWRAICSLADEKKHSSACLLWIDATASKGACLRKSAHVYNSRVNNEQVGAREGGLCVVQNCFAHVRVFFKRAPIDYKRHYYDRAHI